MPKTVAEIRELISKPRKKQEIAKAKGHESRIRLHSEAALERYDCSSAITEFLQFVKNLVKDYDKQWLFMHLLRFPVDTVPCTSEIYDALEKIFDGRDPIYKAEFLTPKAEADWKEYRQNYLSLDRFWRNEAFEELKLRFKSFIVVDLPEIQEEPLPKPYPYFLSLDAVIDYEEMDTYGDWDEMDWILFRVDETHIAFFDRETYQVFQAKKESLEIIGETMNVRHGLGYCPAIMFWCEEHPLSKWLAKLDKLLFQLVSKDQMDLTSAYPIRWVYEQDCDYEHPTTHDRCNGGFLVSEHGEYLVGGRNGGLQECPACSESRLRGAGGMIEMPIPDNDGKQLATPPAGIITTPVDSLKFHVGEIQRRALEIYKGVVGYGGESPNNQAVNEKQVIATFESRTDVLKKFKKQFERAQQWTEQTICKLRYGKIFVSLSVNYGQTFYLVSAEMLLSFYQDAKTKGVNDDVLDGMLNDYHETKYKNNPEQLRRVKILANLEPFRHRSISEVREMYRNTEVSFEDYYIKTNFSSLIARFERENISVLEFGSALNFDKKIEAIYKVLFNYASTIRTETARKSNMEQAANGGGNAAFASASA